ncbi:MAG: hypothetical protein ABS85_08640 [Sphingobacteriales bacterium SCN 48-20]|jgi:hypothetical protein|uniref:DUF6263 family protein n=1 Tax=Terrimonas ferruginea TaxID=249 RepID=UPI00086F1223|nr:DUF6263 family protein [Terrimonas ferruginea]MBN8783156.1 hypothetical protein [Terrimonas ferruginea]ODT92643.1 MAG: hypothetical protein ABS85_08640 [Sphingobacteriales bacterium SCN 48-20]OJW39783.1 MAG: hypothetical protein BGO56_02635 [Sphingobacteriales bacterium 48-107]
MSMHPFLKSSLTLVLGLGLAQAADAQQQAQKVTGKLQFEPGRTIQIKVDQTSTMTQDAMGQTIDFKTSGVTIHSYKVTNATEDNSTLHHSVQRLAFNFEGMGAKRSFDSDNKKDMSGEFGKPIADVLNKSYDVIIDKSGKTLMARPEKFEAPASDDRSAVILNQVRDMTDVVNPPARGSNSFFKVLPDKETGIGDSWRDTTLTPSESALTVYTLSAITDSTIIVDFKRSAAINMTLQIMGSEALNKQNQVSTGQIILDRTTGLMKEKTINTDSNGTTEVMGASLPGSGKMTIRMTVEYL